MQAAGWAEHRVLDKAEVLGVLVDREAGRLEGGRRLAEGVGVEELDGRVVARLHPA